VGLEPSCVIVCPTQSIIAGDLDDPGSDISRLVARHDVAVRAPEQGTRPKLFYKGADAASLDPLRTRIAGDGMIWADTTPSHPTLPVSANGHGPALPAARTVYTTEHPMAWKGMVAAYLVTKSIGAGALIVAALLVLLGEADRRVEVGLVPAGLALAFSALTAALLVLDLKQPTRFLYLLVKPNPGSWLVRGAWILMAYSGLSVLWFLGGVLDSANLVRAVAAPAALLGAAAAGYTAYLFAQCEGRDLWQTPLLLPILLAQAVAAGAAVLLVAAAVIDMPRTDALRWALIGGLGTAAVLLAAELTSRGTAHVEFAIAAMTRGAYARRFWLGGVLLGLVMPGALVVPAIAGVDGATALGASAGVAALAGLAACEDAFVRAGQSVPLS
jgi:formate-dependent nitrite reductase membrane component NrfD